MLVFIKQTKTHLFFNSLSNVFSLFIILFSSLILIIILSIPVCLQVLLLFMYVLKVHYVCNKVYVLLFNLKKKLYNQLKLN